MGTKKSFLDIPNLVPRHELLTSEGVKELTTNLAKNVGTLQHLSLDLSR